MSAHRSTYGPDELPASVERLRPHRGTFRPMLTGVGEFCCDLDRHCHNSTKFGRVCSKLGPSTCQSNIFRCSNAKPSCPVLDLSRSWSTWVRFRLNLSSCRPHRAWPRPSSVWLRPDSLCFGHISAGFEQLCCGFDRLGAGFDRRFDRTLWFDQL